MTRNILLALAWAAAILGVAAIGRSGLIAADAARTLTLVLPILAVLSLGIVNRQACRGRRA